MKTVFDHIRDRLFKPPQLKPDLQTLKETQWSNQFEQLMRNRLVLGAMRYETITEKKHRDGPKYDMIGSAISRLLKYQETGNQEYLIDSANLCLLEFECPTHHNAHMEATDDGEHVQLKDIT